MPIKVGPSALAQALKSARLEAGLTPSNVGTLSESADKVFRVSQPFLWGIENRASVPSPFRLLTLARIYQVPLAVFFKAIGATDAEICGHEVTPEQQRLVELMKDERFARVHAMLQEILEADEREADALMLVIDAVAGKLHAADHAARLVADKAEPYGGENAAKH